MKLRITIPKFGLVVEDNVSRYHEQKLTLIITNY